MINYFLDSDNIFWVKMSDDITLNDIIEYLEEFSQLKDLPKKLHLLYDMQEANLSLDISDIEKISDKTYEATKDYEEIRTALKLPSKMLRRIYPAERGILFPQPGYTGKIARRLKDTKQCSLFALIFAAWCFGGINILPQIAKMLWVNAWFSIAH